MGKLIMWNLLTLDVFFEGSKSGGTWIFTNPYGQGQRFRQIFIFPIRS